MSEALQPIRRGLPARPLARFPRWVIAAVLGLVVAITGVAAEKIPAAPRDHFNDYAGIVSPATARQLDAELTQFERDTSNQIVVAIYPKMQSDSSIEDYTVRVAQAWGVGQADRKNGAVLFLFQESHDVRIVTGYGLEADLPDALCKQIVENEIIPRFRQGDFAGGLTAGVHAMMAAAKHEYQGTGKTVAERHRRSRDGSNPVVFILIVAVIITLSFLRRRRSFLYGRGGRTLWMGGPWNGGGGGGGWSGGGGGSFSGGGGSFGGGGAGGRW